MQARAIESRERWDQPNKTGRTHRAEKKHKDEIKDIRAQHPLAWEAGKKDEEEPSMVGVNTQVRQLALLKQ